MLDICQHSYSFLHENGSSTIAVAQIDAVPAARKGQIYLAITRGFEA